MLDFLSKIWHVLTHLPSAVLWALETLVNVVLSGAAAAIDGLFALLPSMDPGAAIGTPEWLGWLNWLYPVADLVGVLTGAITLYTTYLIVRWALKLLRAV